jgi:acyl-CoA thioesterase-1
MLMAWMLYVFGSGLALYLAAGMILLAVIFLPKARGRRRMVLAMSARLAMVVAVLSAVPLSGWLYAVAICVTVGWLWHERKAGSATLNSAAKSSAAPRPNWRRILQMAAGTLWLGMILLELPYQITPRLDRSGSPPLYVIGDSITAGMGGTKEVTWPELLPEHVEVHNLARTGATTAMAVAAQANRIPPTGGLVLIEIGGNDLLGGTSAAQFRTDLDNLLAMLSQENRTLVMFELPLPPLCNAYGRAQRELAAKYNVRLIPKRVLIGILADRQATSDTIHLTEHGHQRLADAVWHVIGGTYAER